MFGLNAPFRPTIRVGISQQVEIAVPCPYRVQRTDRSNGRHWQFRSVYR
ncbi:hypothetical protein [Egbenema bharatensis]